MRLRFPLPTVRARLFGSGLALAGTLVVAFGVMAPPESCPDVSEDQLRSSATETVDWFVRNQQDDGRWLYLYYADRDQSIPDYNVVRHAGVTMGLYMAAGAGIPGALESADKGLVWAQERLLEPDDTDDSDWTALSYRGETPVGAAALLTAGLTQRRTLTGETKYDDLLQRLGNFMASQTEPSGAVLAYYDRIDNKPIAGEYSKYYTGEAYWAFAALHEQFPDAGWDEVTDRVGNYLASHRDDAEDIWPPLPDHWVAYGLSETTASGIDLNDEQLDYARRQAGLFGAQVRWVSQRHGPWGLAVRGAPIPRGGGYGVVGEALTGLWLVAQDDPRLEELRRPLSERARCIAGLAVEQQVDEAEASDFADPERVQGAWVHDGETRMDDQQHALSALLRTIPIVQAEGGRGGQPIDTDGSDPAPSAWLLILALLAAVNPVRTRLASPERSTKTTLIGGLIGSGIIVTLTLLSIPLIRATDASDPAVRIAAATVAVCMGLVALVGRTPKPEPALAGWQAAIVPIAAPLFANPAVLLLAISIRADRGFSFLLVSLAISVLALAMGAGAPIARARTDGVGRVVMAWAARLTAAGLIAASVVLLIDGIFDV